LIVLGRLLDHNINLLVLGIPRPKVHDHRVWEAYPQKFLTPIPRQNKRGRRKAFDIAH
jgi:hypothetical protein